jgi:hypothetical protein
VPIPKIKFAIEGLSPKSATLTIYDDANNGPQSITLTGAVN